MYTKIFILTVALFYSVDHHDFDLKNDKNTTSVVNFYQIAAYTHPNDCNRAVNQARKEIYEIFLNETPSLFGIIFNRNRILPTYNGKAVEQIRVFCNEVNFEQNNVLNLDLRRLR